MYDADGRVTQDSVNRYAYDAGVLVDRSWSTGWDAEGRVCAVRSFWGGMTGYLYDAEGNRVAKGTIMTVPSLVSSSNPYGMSCDPAVNGFQVTTETDRKRRLRLGESI